MLNDARPPIPAREGRQKGHKYNAHRAGGAIAHANVGRPRPGSETVWRRIGQIRTVAKFASTRAQLRRRSKPREIAHRSSNRWHSTGPLRKWAAGRLRRSLGTRRVVFVWRDLGIYHTAAPPGIGALPGAASSPEMMARRGGTQSLLGFPEKLGSRACRRAGFSRKYPLRRMDRYLFGAHLRRSLCAPMPSRADGQYKTGRRYALWAPASNSFDQPFIGEGVRPR